MTDARLLDRSNEFEATLVALLGNEWWATIPTNARHRASVMAARLSTEHARGVRLLLLEAIAPHSGAALLRLQFEALLRAVWIAYGATDDQVRRLTAALTEEGEQGAKNLPGPLDMLSRVMGCTPVALHDPLVQFYKTSWRALNSYVHAGIHPLTRASSGFPVELADQLTRLSNALLHVTYRLQASFRDQVCVDAVTRAWPNFRDALPPITLPHNSD